MKPKPRPDGFSLIELLIVVAIILIIAAIAIPNYMRSKLAANEASAVSSVRTINTSQIAYAATFPSVGFADNLAKLAAPTGGAPVSATAAGLLDWVLGCATQPCPKSGYVFMIVNATGTPVSSFGVTGVPQVVGTTGVRGFCGDQLSQISYDPAGGTNCTQVLQ